MEFLLLINTVSAKRLFDGKLPSNHSNHSSKWLEDFLLSYPTLSTVISLLLMAVLYGFITQCRKRRLEDTEVKVLLKSQSLQKESKPLKLPTK